MSQNNQRSDTKNPNNPAHKQDGDNRSNQKNPNHEPTNPKPVPKPEPKK